MLEQLDQQLRDAYQHAHDCAERAKATQIPQEREDWLILERRYLMLARSLELSRRIERFTDEVRRARLRT